MSRPRQGQPATPQALFQVLRRQGPVAAFAYNLRAMAANPVDYPVTMMSFGTLDSRKLARGVSRFGPQGAAAGVGIERAEARLEQTRAPSSGRIGGPRRGRRR